MRLLARSEVWASYDEVTGQLYGGAGGCDVRIPLGEGVAECSCGRRRARGRLCPEAVAVVLRALVDRVIAPRGALLDWYP